MTPLSLPNYTFLMITHSFSINTVKKTKSQKFTGQHIYFAFVGMNMQGDLVLKLHSWASLSVHTPKQRTNRGPFVLMLN